jgi:uncharacterized membrane protein HdeD (DUF308 family)
MDGASLLIMRGVLGVVIGLICFAWPGITIAVLVGIFAIYAILDGITNLFIGLHNTATHGRSWMQVLQGIVGIAAGVLTFIWPGVTALVLILFIGAWAIVTGGLEIAAAIRLRRVIHGEWMLGFSGLISIIFGILVLAFPAAGAVGISWILGAYSAAAGFILIALGIRLRTGPALAA